MTLSYLWAKMFKKIRGSTVVHCKIHKTSKVEADSNMLNTTFYRYAFCVIKTIIGNDVWIGEHTLIKDDPRSCFLEKMTFSGTTT